MQCQAKCKSSGQQCRRRAVEGKRVCTVHGGLTPSGMASPHFKTGSRSKDLPERLRARYEEAASDPELLSTRGSIAIMESRLQDLLARVDLGEAGEVWRLAQEALDKFLKEFYSGKENANWETPLRDLQAAIKRGRDDYMAWDEVNKTLEQERKLIETEQKRLVAMQQNITAERAMVLMSAIIDIIRRNVKDRAELAAIQREFVKLMNKQPANTELLEPSDVG